MTGRVWLVGAGPGDVGLLTIKGKKALENADVVLYDRLVGDGVLGLIPDQARCYDVGKEAGHHSVTQEQINRILIDEARQGHKVVRLKGGDPFLFGRGGEELETLRAADIPCEVVPGVSSAIAVPAYAGIPVTHRDYASSFHVIAGHAREGSGLDIEYSALAKLGGTLVFLMGLGALPDLCQELVAAGMPADTPAAVIERGASARQRRVDGTLASLETRVRKAEMTSPALIVVGQVALPKEEWNWVGSLPLFGKRVLVTRPQERAQELATRLASLGAEVLVYPCIRIQPLEPELPPLSEYDWVTFTSPTGVECFFADLRKRQVDIRTLNGAKIAAVGSGTAAALMNHGLLVEVMPEIYDGMHLAKAMVPRMKKGDRVLLPRAEDGAPGLVEELTEAGMEVREIAMYRTIYTTKSWQPQDTDLGIFASASAVRGFAKACPASRLRAICIGRQTAEAAKALGWSVRIAKTATLEALIEATQKEETDDY